MSESAFAKLRKNRKNQSRNIVDKLAQESQGGGNKFKDDRIFYPQRDQNGNGYAIIRFLEPPVGKPPFVRLFTHGFKEAGGWLIENCPTTIDQPCPICANNSEHWNTETKEGKAIASKRKRKKAYYSNILVVADSKNPENEGKVFIFRYGQKIFDKLASAAKPEFEDETPIDPFDLWEGANFKLKIRKVEGQTNYDKSEFEKPSPVADSDEAIEAIWKQQYDLTEIIAADKFKSEEDLAKRLARVTGQSATATGTAEDLPSDDADDQLPSDKADSGDSNDGDDLPSDSGDEGSTDQFDSDGSSGEEGEDDDMALFRQFSED